MELRSQRASVSRLALNGEFMNLMTVSDPTKEFYISARWPGSVNGALS